MIERVQTRIPLLKEATGASSICGWMRDEVALYLHSLIMLYRPELVLQTGHLWGKSALVILEALGYIRDQSMIFEAYNPSEGDKEFSRFVDERMPKRTDGRLVSVDPDPFHVPHPELGINLLKEWYGESFEYHKESSHDFLVGGEWAGMATGKRIFGVVDGDHTPDGCRLDIEHLVNVGAECIFVDDTVWRTELNDVVAEFGGQVYTHFQMPLYNGVGVLCRNELQS